MFNIPKRNYNSGKQTTVMAVRLPAKMRKAMARQSKELGLSQNELMSMVLDQFIAALEGRKSLVTSKGTHEEGELDTVTIRLDRTLLEAIDKRKVDHSPKLSRTQIVTLAFDYYLCQTQ